MAEKKMEQIIYTCGYGIIQGTRDEKRRKFRDRLACIQRGIGKHLFVVDIRKAGCGSRNGPYFSQGDGMLQTVRTLSGKTGQGLKEIIIYVSEPHLANEYGRSRKALRAYAWRLELATEYLDGDLSDMGAAFDYVARLAKTYDRAVFLMCGCKEAFKKNGTIPNCHRVPLADVLLNELGEGWSVCHL